MTGDRRAGAIGAACRASATSRQLCLALLEEEVVRHFITKASPIGPALVVATPDLTLCANLAGPPAHQMIGIKPAAVSIVRRRGRQVLPRVPD